MDEKPLITVEVVVPAVTIDCPECGHRFKVMISTSPKEPECEHLFEPYAERPGYSMAYARCVKCGLIMKGNP